jgi:Domain of unknown function (DUF4375)
MLKKSESAYWILVKPLFEKVDIYTTPENYLASIAALSQPLVNVYAAHFCLSEIHNGGLLQFFWNNTGVLEPEAVEGFKAVGMPKLAALVSETAALLGDTYPRDRDDRWDALVAASGRDDDDMTEIIKEIAKKDGGDKEADRAVDFYRVFVKATEPLGFDELDKKAWELAGTENGGFDQAADQHLRSIGLTEPQ